jgi:naphthalene 1,2-dioxygenase ferredoxin component
MSDQWIGVAALDELDADYPSPRRVGDLQIALHLVAGAVYATSDICSHAYAHLSDGLLEGYEVLCPLHGGSFDVRTGAAVRAPCTAPVAVYATKIESGRVYVRIGDDRHATS